MFEKEAEERAKRKINNFIPFQWGVSLIRTEQTYETVEGAPHFYLRSLAKMWKEGAEFGYNKANEWHYVKDGDLPEKGDAELKETVTKMNNVITETFSNLTKAKEIIEELYNIIPASMADYAKEPMEHARKFMTEE